MVCKEDVVSWFKKLKSYNRIEIIHTLFNMCVPFELRFLGTCLEEFVRLEGGELRGIDLRVNNATEFSVELAACQVSEPTNIRVRRRMALFLSLLRENHCIPDIFNLLTAWGDHEFLRTAKGDPLEELLLVYIMAALHPKFESHQREICGAIFNKIESAAGSKDDEMLAQSHAMQELPVSNVKPFGITTSATGVAGTTNVAAATAAAAVASMATKPFAPTLAEQTPSPNVMSQLGSFEPSTGSQQSESASQPSSPIESRSSSPRVKNISSRHSHKHDRSSSLEAPSSTHQTLAAASSHDGTYIDVSDKGNVKIGNEGQYDDLVGSQQQHASYMRNGYVKSSRPRQLNKTQVHQGHGSIVQQHHLQQQQQLHQQPMQQQMYAAANPNGLTAAMHNMALGDGTEAIGVGHNEDDTSSGESIDETSPDTSSKGDLYGGAVVQSSNKKYQQMPLLPQRHKPHAYNQSMPGQSTTTHVTSNVTQPTAVQGDVSPTPQQPQLQQTHPSQMLPQNNNLVTSTMLMSNKPGGIVTSTIQGFGIPGPGNTSVIYQQYSTPPPPPHHIQQGIQQSQLNTTYHYHTQQIPMSNRAAILTTPNTTTPAAQSNTFRVPAQYLPPNGDVMYSYATPIAYMPTSAIPRQASHQTHPAVSVIQQSALGAVAVKHGTPMAAYPTISDTKVLSCFNCGAHSHSGRDCHESSIEEVTRGTVYKLDYTAPPLNETKPELDNGLDASSLPTVSNK